MEQQIPASIGKRYIKLYIEIVLLTLLCATQYFGISIGNLGLTCCVLGIHLLMNDIEECTIGLFCALPVFNLLNMRIGSISMYYLMVMIFWLRYFEYHDWKINRTKLLILLALLFIRITSGVIRDTLTWFVLITVLVLTYGEEFFDKNIQKVVLFTTIVFLISSLAGYLMLRAGRSIYTGGTVWAGKVMSYRFAGIIGDPVFFSQFCALLAAANLTLACHHKKYLIPGILFAVACLVLCVESYAKTGMLLIALCAFSAGVWFIWNRLQNKRTAVLAIFLLFIGVAGVFLGINYILTNTDNLIVQNYISRLSSDDILTGRWTIWAGYINKLGSSWRSLFLALPHKVYSIPVVIAGNRQFTCPHNIFLESVCLFGLIPTLAMLLLVFVAMYRCFISRKGILWQMPICVMLASGITLHGHMEFQYYTLIAIALSFLSVNHSPGSKVP